MELKPWSAACMAAALSLFESHLYGIETLLSRQLRTTDVEFESHLYGIETTGARWRPVPRRVFESHLYGIETALSKGVYKTYTGLNRTSMELKRFAFSSSFASL